jgi:choline kinase
MSGSVRRAVIVAAGRGQRLGADCPKPLVRVGSETLLARSLASLRSVGVDEVLVVIGHDAPAVRQHVAGRARCVLNPFYALTNNMGSLWFAREFAAAAPFLYLHADLIYEPEVLRRCLDGVPGSCVAIDRHTGRHPCGDEEMKFVSREGMLSRSDKAIPASQAEGEWLGIARFDAETATALFAEIERQLAVEHAHEAYDTRAISALCAAGHRIRLADCTGLRWVEIDFPEDLARARALLPDGGAA